MSAQDRRLDTWQCPLCREWLEQPRQRQQAWRDKHKLTCAGRDTMPQKRPDETVKRASLWDGVIDTFATEGELNGWRPKQGALL